MINQTLPSYQPTNPPLFTGNTSSNQRWLVFAGAVFLVSVPVFIEAPLVRTLPILSLLSTGVWLWLSIKLMLNSPTNSNTYIWGDLLFGFSWTWFTGSIYWGWFRFEPIWHLPIEAIGLPFALWGLAKNWGKIGNWFYLGSLLGTVVTDLYFYLVNLIPDWRQIMISDPALASQILQNALTKVQTPWGQSWAVMLALLLMTLGVVPLVQKQSHWYAFSGAVLSTILVDSLFLIAATIA